jgi:hypothetical protein
MAPTTAAGTTVLGDGYDVADRIDYNAKPVPGLEPKGKSSTNGVPVSKFDDQTNYLEDESRPFFVVVGKGGVIEALQRLDRQLQNV